MILAPRIPAPLAAPNQPSQSAPMIRLETNPIQRAGVPTRLRRIEYGGPTLGLDVRLYLDRHTLSAMLEAAEATPTGRAMVDGPGLVIQAHRGGDGNAYEVWTLVSASPCRPEPGPLSADPGPVPPFDGDVALDLLGRPAPGGGRVYGRVGDPSVRMYLDHHSIAQLLKYANQALSGRVQLDSVGLVVEDYLDESIGFRFEVWTIACGGTPRPEPVRFQQRK